MSKKIKPEQKYIPIRTCISCSKKGAKKEFTRFVRLDDKIVLDLSGKARGRGANICPTEICLEKAYKGKLLNKALKTKYDISKEEFSKMKQDITAYIEEKTFRPNNKPVKIRVSKEKIKNNEI